MTAAWEPKPAPSTFTDPEGRRSVAAGLNGSTLDWAKVAPQLAQRTLTIAFDKAGMGFSDPGRLPPVSTLGRPEA